ncbi:hypothetical protein KCP75_06320 [Salmonella enterica subsp. enterica]|nr:hypothetical protein KCP75_06320 [Salmonella enterica subsp. enterica]
MQPCRASGNYLIFPGRRRDFIRIWRYRFPKGNITPLPTKFLKEGLSMQNIVVSLTAPPTAANHC